MRPIASLALLVAAVPAAFSQLAASPWPWNGGDFYRGRSLPFAFCTNYTTVADLQGLSMTSGVCDEEGNVFVCGTQGLVKLSPTYDVVWTRPGYGAVILAQHDGGVLAQTNPDAFGNQYVAKLDSDGNEVGRSSIPCTAGSALPDGGLVVTLASGFSRLGPDLQTRYIVNENAGARVAPDGTVYYPHNEADSSDIRQLDDSGNVVRTVDVSSYREGSNGVDLWGIGLLDQLGIAAETYPYVVLDGTGSFLWHDLPAPASSFQCWGADGRFVTTRTGSYWTQLGWYDPPGQYHITETFDGNGASTENVSNPTTDPLGNLFFAWSSRSKYGSSQGALMEVAETGSAICAPIGACPWLYGPRGELVCGQSHFRDPDMIYDVVILAGSSGLTCDADILNRRGTANAIDYTFELRGSATSRTTVHRGQSPAGDEWTWSVGRGDYGVAVRATHTLRKVVPVTVTDSVVPFGVVLRTGDVNDDNRVDLLDIASWLHHPIDLNNDGNPGLMDLSCILVSYGRVGDD